MYKKLITSSFAVLLLLAGAIGTAAVASIRSWNVDSAHTQVKFSVNHFFTPVTGKFDDFQVELNFDAENPDASFVSARIRVDSINTGNERRDNHLRSEDWFSAEKYPYITFESKSVEKVADGHLRAVGTLSIKDHEKIVTLDINLLGTRDIPEQMREMLGGTQRVASFTASTSIDRGDFEVGVGSWAGNMVVGDEIVIEILVEAHQN